MAREVSVPDQCFLQFRVTEGVLDRHLLFEAFLVYPLLPYLFLLSSFPGSVRPAWECKETVYINCHMHRKVHERRKEREKGRKENTVLYIYYF